MNVTATVFVTQDLSALTMTHAMKEYAYREYLLTVMIQIHAHLTPVIVRTAACMTSSRFQAPVNYHQDSRAYAQRQERI